MKSTILSFFAIASLVGAAAQTDLPKQPIYLYLYARVTDHVNLGITEDRIHRLLSTVDQYRRAHPDAHVTATILFSGAVSEALARRNPQSHIVDFVKGYVQRGVIEVGYDGSDEPTYVTRPFVDFNETSDPERRWVLRRAAEQKILGEGRDPLTGSRGTRQRGWTEEDAAGLRRGSLYYGRD